jgi:signal transduction histidine kinase
LLADFVYRAAPALTSGVGLESGSSARLGWELIASLMLAAAALAHRKTIQTPGRRLVALAVVACAGTVMLGTLFEEMANPDSNANAVNGVGTTGVGSHPVALGVQIASATVLVVAGLAFLVGSQRGQLEDRLLAGASFLLAAASLEYLAIPSVVTDWLTPGEGLRLAAYALVLVSAYARYMKARRHETRAALTSERERLARDLHDGLAQDLACIAIAGQQLDSQLGPEHPLMIATRRALAASRGAIADLTAGSAPTTEAALRLIADELEHRFDLTVDVEVEADKPLTADDDFEPAHREHLIRIAREAIVNAAVHGTAHHVRVVLLLRKGRDLLLTVTDDGRGITDEHAGFGLRTMRARAASLGGQLSTCRMPDGGTELKLLISLPLATGGTPAL